MLHYWPLSAAEKNARKKALTKAAPVWVAPAPGEDELSHAQKFLAKHMPTSSRTKYDRVYGRAWLMSQGYPPKSISWTRRGWDEFAIYVVNTAWERHIAYTGDALPWQEAA